METWVRVGLPLDGFQPKPTIRGIRFVHIVDNPGHERTLCRNVTRRRDNNS